MSFDHRPAPGPIFLFRLARQAEYDDHMVSSPRARCSLRRRDFRNCSLIGSTSKRRKFENRLLARGVPEEALARRNCPIGISGISGKHHSKMAIAVAAEILQAHERAGTATSQIADVV